MSLSAFLRWIIRKDACTELATNAMLFLSVCIIGGNDFLGLSILAEFMGNICLLG
jgi:hypothetical protein